MKAYTLTLYLICLNLAFSVLANLQVFTMGSANPVAPVVFGFDAGIIEDALGFLDITIAGLDVIDILAAIAAFVNAVLSAAFMIPFFCAQFGVPDYFIPVIWVPFAYTYLAAIVQLITGRILPLFE